MVAERKEPPASQAVLATPGSIVPWNPISAPLPDPFGSRTRNRRPRPALYDSRPLPRDHDPALPALPGPCPAGPSLGPPKSVPKTMTITHLRSPGHISLPGRQCAAAATVTAEAGGDRGAVPGAPAGGGRGGVRRALAAVLGSEPGVMKLLWIGKLTTVIYSQIQMFANFA